MFKRINSLLMMKHAIASAELLEVLCTACHVPLYDWKKLGGQRTRASCTCAALLGWCPTSTRRWSRYLKAPWNGCQDSRFVCRGLKGVLRFGGVLEIERSGRYVCKDKSPWEYRFYRLHISTYNRRENSRSVNMQSNR